MGWIGWVIAAGFAEAGLAEAGFAAGDFAIVGFGIAGFGIAGLTGAGRIADDLEPGAVVARRAALGRAGAAFRDAFGREALAGLDAAFARAFLAELRVRAAAPDLVFLLVCRKARFETAFLATIALENRLFGTPRPTPA